MLSLAPGPGSPDRTGQQRNRRAVPFEPDIDVLQTKLRQAQLILDSAVDYAIITMDLDGSVTGWSAGAQHITGYAEAEIIGRSGDVVFTSEDRANGVFAGELRRARETGRASNERWHLRRDGTRFWASGLMMPLQDADGRPEGFLNILRDRTDARVAVERRELLIAEMNHRIKNTFAIVQAVAVQTERFSDTAAEFLAVFHARLAVLARSNDVLTRADWLDAPLRDVVESALEAYNGEARQIILDGPPVLLAANLAVTVSLALHELATNAVKYGALSTPSGQVSLSWRVRPGQNGARRVELVWREQGGPVVKPPTHRGFGSQLLERGMQPSGTVTLDYRPEGLECLLCLPLNGTAGAEQRS